MAHKKNDRINYHPVSGWEVAIVTFALAYFAGHIIAAL